MELQEQLNAVQGELKVYKDSYENISAEKIALDQLLVQTLKGALDDKKSLILAQIQAQKDANEIRQLKVDKEALLNKLNEHIQEKEAQVSVYLDSEAQVAVCLDSCEENAA